MVPIDIDCVDGTLSSKDGFIEETRRRLPNALRVHSVGHMVRQILARLGSTAGIRRLRIFGHGAPGEQGLGTSLKRYDTFHYRSIALATDGSGLRYPDILAQLTNRFIRNAPPLGRVGPHLAPVPGPLQNGWAELHGCNVGVGSQGMEFVRNLSSLWAVRVAAGVGYQIAAPGFEGYYLVGYPDGRVLTRMGHDVTNLTRAD